MPCQEKDGLRTANLNLRPEFIFQHKETIFGLVLALVGIGILERELLTGVLIIFQAHLAQLKDRLFFK